MPSPLAFGVEITDAATMITIIISVICQARPEHGMHAADYTHPAIPRLAMAEQSAQAPLSPEERDEVW